MGDAMTFDRDAAQKPSRTQAWAIRVGEEWFCGFGGTPASGPRPKLSRTLAHARLMTSPQMARDYQLRLFGQGYGSVMVRIEVAPDVSPKSGSSGSAPGADAPPNAP